MNELYTVGGLAKADCAENLIYAKKVVTGRGTEYWVRHATTGPDAPHLLNPWGMHFSQGIDDKRVATILGKKRYEFKKVNEEVFKAYVIFLETRNERYYRYAERAQD